MVAGICESNRFGGSQRSRSKSLACQGCDYFQSREENILNINGSYSCVNNDITDVDQTHGCNHLAELFLSRFCQPVYGHRSHYLLSLHSLINSVYCILFCIPKFFELRAYLSCERWSQPRQSKTASPSVWKYGQSILPDSQYTDTSLNLLK